MEPTPVDKLKLEFLGFSKLIRLLRVRHKRVIPKEEQIAYLWIRKSLNLNLLECCYHADPKIRDETQELFSWLDFRPDDVLSYIEKTQNDQGKLLLDAINCEKRMQGRLPSGEYAKS